jgi:hypothetical protein
MNPARILALALAFWAGLVAPAPARATDAPAAGVLELVCSVDQPVVGPHELVKATVLVNVPEPESLRHRWQADASGFVAPGSELSREAGGFTAKGCRRFGLL